MWAGRVAAGEAELLRLIGEWDAREGWAPAGALSCAHWLMWRCGLSIGPARQRVRVARALRELPMTSAALAGGQLTYSQVRAVTRVATAEDEQTWLELAEQTTAAQLEKAVRGVRRARQGAKEPEEREPFRAGVEDRWDDDGNLILTTRIPAALAPAVMAVLEQARADEQAERDAVLATVEAAVAAASATVQDGSAEPSPPRADGSAEPSPGATDVPEEYYYDEPEYPGTPYIGWLPSEQPPGLDGKITAWRVEKDRLRAKARAWAEHQQRVLEAAERQGAVTRRATLGDGLIRLLTRDSNGRSRVKLELLVDPMSGWSRTTRDELLPPAMTAEILQGKRLPRIRPITADDLARQDQGRSTRLVTTRLRQLLGHLDGECCRFPGCTRIRKLQAHHVTFWRNGGRTDLANLALVCSRHHTLIHSEGFRLELRDDRTLIVTSADGTRLEHLPAKPWQPKGDLPGQVLSPSQWNGDRLDLHHVAWVLSQHAA